jgi:hypothetical protein
MTDLVEIGVFGQDGQDEQDGEVGSRGGPARQICNQEKTTIPIPNRAI